jgi:diguanylate cyclase (GGDEF)-like protein/PAS domain S-box-containing protein
MISGSSHRESTRENALVAPPLTERLSTYRQILVATSSAIAFVDTAGAYLQQNPAHRNLFGYSDAELVLCTPATIYGEASFQRMMRRSPRVRRFRATLRGRGANGDFRDIDLTALLIRDERGNPEAWALIQRDITESAARQRETAASISLLQATLESTADGILVVDRTGRIVSYNQRFARMWRLPDEVLAERDEQHVRDFTLDQLVDPDAFTAGVLRLYRHPGRKSFDVLEFRDGRRFERYSRPQRLGRRIIGRVWSFRDVTRQRRTEDALRESESRYRALFQDSRHAIYITSLTGRFEEANAALLELIGYTREELQSASARDHYADLDEREHFQAAIEAHGYVREYPIRLKRKDGEIRHCLLSATLRRGPADEVIGYQGIVEDVTARYCAERALRSSEEYFRSLIENALEIITTLNADGTIRYESPSTYNVLGYLTEDLVGRSFFDFVHPDDLPLVRSEFVAIMHRPGAIVSLELRFRNRAGDWRILEAQGRNLLDNPTVTGVVINARDVTERKRVEEQLLHDALHDRLTGLPNRALFMDRLGQMIRRSRRDDAPGFAVLFVDLDRFKVVNDSLGHMIGDELLVATARRIESCLRPGDTAARLGGDEFTVLLDGVTSEDDARSVADRLQAVLASPIAIRGHDVFAAASIGIAVGPAGYRRPEEVLRDADIAMYRAKSLGPGHRAVFDRTMHTQAVSLLRLETELRAALRNGEFRVHYQPIIALEAGTLHGFEALLRWNHPVRGLLAPDVFLAVAEDSGLMVAIGDWLLRTVLAQIHRWNSGAGTGRTISVHVNLSGREIMQPGMAANVSRLCQEYGVAQSQLQLELTESTLVDNSETAIHALAAFRAHGLRLSLDDFGTGYSSLSYLHRFPLDTVKIDRAFIARIQPGGQNAEFASTIISLARSLGMDVIAEGIESDAQLRFLREAGCEFGQGFHFAEAVTPARARAFLRRRSRWS